MDLVQWIPAVTAVGGLGVGSAFGTWLGTGRARREVRGAVLKALGSTEANRWLPAKYEDFDAAIHDLETAGLIARIPRAVIHHYVVCASTARRLSHEDFEDSGGTEDSGIIPPEFANIVREAAEIVTQMAWRPWWRRMTYRIQLRRLRSRTQTLVNRKEQLKRMITYAQKFHGALPGRLGKLEGIKSKPPMPELPPPPPFPELSE